MAWCHHTNGALGLIAVNITTVLSNIFRFARANVDRVSAVKPLNKKDRNLLYFNFFRLKMQQLYCVVAKIFWQKMSPVFVVETAIVCGQNSAFSGTNSGPAHFYTGIDKSTGVTGVDCDELPDAQRCTNKFPARIVQYPKTINQNSGAKRSSNFLKTTRMYEEI